MMIGEKKDEMRNNERKKLSKFEEMMVGVRETEIVILTLLFSHSLMSLGLQNL